MQVLGEFRVNATVRLMWNTNAVAGESITRATNGSIRIYKNGSTTERTSSAGITDTEDFDTLTGVHHLSIDLSDNTDAGFYAAGNDYFVVLQGATIDGKTINAALASFSIENRNPQVDVTKFGGTAGTFSGGRPEVNATHWGGTAVASANVRANLVQILGTAPTESAAGRIAAALTTLLDVASPVFTVASVNQTGDCFARIGANGSGLTQVLLGANAIVSSSIASGALIAGKFGADFLTASGLAADAVAEIAAAIAAGSVGSVTGNVGGNVVGSIGSLATQAKADVNAEVVDAVNVDTYAEPGQEAPPATTNLVKKIGYLYKFLRNRIVQTSSQLEVYADNGTTLDQKASVSDDGTSFVRGKIGTGP